jgi:hypothetical protein
MQFINSYQILHHSRKRLINWFLTGKIKKVNMIFSQLISLCSQISRAKVNCQENLKKDKLHFWAQKNAILDTELNFARIWSRTT